MQSRQETKWFFKQPKSPTTAQTAKETFVIVQMTPQNFYSRDK